MSDMNIFKRKIIVIDDDDNTEIDNPEVTHKIKDIKDLNHSINKKPEENKSNITHTNKSINTLKSENHNKEKKDLIQSNNISKSKVLENIIKQKSNEDRDALKKSADKNKLNIEKQNPLDKIKKAIQISSSSEKKKSLPIEKEKIQQNNKKSDSSDSEDDSYDDEESEDDSYDSDDSEDSSSNSKSHESVSEKKTPMKKPDTKHVSSAEKIIKKKIPMKIKEEEKSSKVELKKISRSIASPKVLKTKNSLVSQLLTRWWYALPKWPPEDFDPSVVLEENKLNKVEKSEWKIEQNLNEKGFKKCIELDGYKFVFVDYLGKIHDLRPHDTIPSFNNFAKKPEKELYKLLIKALRNQIEALEKGEKYSEEDIDLIASLKDELNQTESNYARIR